MIYVPNRIVSKYPHSLTDSLNKIMMVKEGGRDYHTRMLDGTTLKCDFLDIVSALATKSDSDVDLIDLFQLTNRREKTPPDHLYPKFKVFLEEFKNGLFAEKTSNHQLIY